MTDDFKIGFCCRCRRAGLSAERTEALLKKAAYSLKSDPTYDDANKVFSRLTFEDRANLVPRHPDFLRDVPKDMLFDRQVAVDENGNPVGFSEFYYRKDKAGRQIPPHNIVAVAPEARGNRLAKLMTEATIRKARKEKIRRLVWEAFADNDPSIQAAISAGFEDRTPKNAKGYRKFVYNVPAQTEKKAYFEKQANPFGTVARAVSPALKRLFRANGAKSRFFKLPSFFKKSPAAPAHTDWSQYFFAQGRWPNNVASFYDDIKLPIKRNSRLAGIPEHDYRQTVLMRRGAYNDVPVEINRNLGPYNGYTHFRRIDSKHVSPTIEVGQYPNHFTLVHEFDHARNGAVGLSEKERNLLAKTYKFTPDDLQESYGYSVESLTPRQQTIAIADEMSATNSEHQFAVYERLANRLHRNPTYDEYTKFIDNASLSDLRNWRRGNFDGYRRNAYQQSADNLARNRFSEEDLENYRKALRWLGGFAVAPASYRMYGTQPQND